ncbi:hypothetical protein [Mesoflavibacter zeaxanthinifaciens]|uniref:hypothetical protein n=1 Tax=Mesoflavibacter zeaxanthinifaciens TaxID=393060 RepID=UPI0026EB4213|nr:hypothetical protein [Mesoflavibacter zeaxanthinifaciens]
MLFNTSYTDKEITKQINNLVGKPFSFIKAIKLKGIGSKRMIIDEVSPNLHTIVNLVNDINYGSIELRPKGILIHIGKGLQRFAWVIPYYKLVIYKTNGASIHADGKFIHFRENKTFKENKQFFKKLLDQKITFDSKFSTIPYNE